MCFFVGFFYFFNSTWSLRLKFNISSSLISKPEELPYLVCFFHITNFATCCWVESWKSLSSAGQDPLIVNENLWESKCLAVADCRKTLGMARACSRWTLSPLPWCSWYPGLGQAEEEAKPWPPRSFRSLLFHSVPFLGSRSSRVCLLALCSLSASPLLFYNNVESAPPRSGAGKPNSTPLTKAFLRPYSLLQTHSRN